MNDRTPSENDTTHALWREKMHEIIFEADTPAGKIFDICLLLAILLSVLAVSLETVEQYEEVYALQFEVIEWMFTILFTIEYVLRLMCVRSPRKYVFSFFGVVDLISILPTYFGILFPGSQSFAVIRSLRLLRIFRILKLVQFLNEAATLKRAIWESRTKIAVFFVTVLVAVTISGTAMYQIEDTFEVQNPSLKNQFTSIPQSMYWAIVTMTTVGYGDVVPQTTPGKLISALLILLGYSLIIVPTGFLSAELAQVSPKKSVTTIVCKTCIAEGHDFDAIYCKYCGEHL